MPQEARELNLILYFKVLSLDIIIHTYSMGHDTSMEIKLTSST